MHLGDLPGGDGARIQFSVLQCVVAENRYK